MLKPEAFRILRGFYDSLTSPEGCPPGEFRKGCGDCDEYDEWGNLLVSACYSYFQEPKLISISPDGLDCKLTEYGQALFEETNALQKAWKELPIIPLDDTEKSQIQFSQGEPFRAKYFVTQLLNRAQVDLRIQDNYCAYALLAWLYNSQAEIRILTSKKTLKQDSAFEPLYKDFKREKPRAEVRLTENVHDRMIILDQKEVFQVGASLKDLGQKATTIIRLQNVSAMVTRFDAMWSAAEPL